MLIKAMILILIAAFAGLFFLKGPNGEVILKLEDLKPEVAPAETVSTPEKVYRWQDENGVWQFSNQPADEGNGQLIELDGNINIMPSLDASSKKAPTSTSATAGMNLPAGLTTVSGSQVEEMMETVNNLQETVDNRKAEIDQLSAGKP